MNGYLNHAQCLLRNFQDYHRVFHRAVGQLQSFSSVYQSYHASPTHLIRPTSRLDRQIAYNDGTITSHRHHFTRGTECDALLNLRHLGSEVDDRLSFDTRHARFTGHFSRTHYGYLY